MQIGNYVTRPDDLEVGIIENIAIENSPQNGIMLVVSGRFAKSILDRRHIYNLRQTSNTPTILRGNVESAVRAVVANNAISCNFDTKRNISFLALGALAGIAAIIVDEEGNPAQKQVSYENLLSYTDEVLEEYGLSSIITLDDETKNFLFSVYAGADRSADNAAGNLPVIFSPEYDNLSSSNYSIETALEKNAALIGGEGEGVDRFYSVLAPANKSGLDRRETWVDASSINRTYKDEDDDEEHTYTVAEYREMLNSKGKQDLATLVSVEKFDGVLNVAGGIWRLNVDYFLGDIVSLQDNTIGKFANVRIAEITEAQDENGYTVEVTYRN